MSNPELQLSGNMEPPFEPPITLNGAAYEDESGFSDTIEKSEDTTEYDQFEKIPKSFFRKGSAAEYLVHGASLVRKAGEDLEEAVSGESDD